MSAGSGFHVEGVEKFLLNVDLADAAVRRGARRGMGKAMHALLNDAIMESPAVPLDRGTLRGSGSAFVGRKCIQTGPAPSESDAEATPETSTPPFPLQIGEAIEGQVGFNTPYAARLHEHPEFTFGETRTKRGRPKVEGTGGKFLERPLSANRRKYMSVVAKEIQAELARGPR